MLYPAKSDDSDFLRLLMNEGDLERITAHKNREEKGHGRGYWSRDDSSSGGGQ